MAIAVYQRRHLPLWQAVVIVAVFCVVGFSVTLMTFESMGDASRQTVLWRMRVCRDTAITVPLI